MTSKIVDVDVDVYPPLDAIYPPLDAIYPPLDVYPPLISDECLSSDDGYFSSVDLTPKSQENKDINSDTNNNTNKNTNIDAGISTQTPLDLCIVCCCTILCSPG
jgi:hypothetical protein